MKDEAMMPPLKVRGTVRIKIGEKKPLKNGHITQKELEECMEKYYAARKKG